jgi:hypothetical protein
MLTRNFLANWRYWLRRRWLRRSRQTALQKWLFQTNSADFYARLPQMDWPAGKSVCLSDWLTRDSRKTSDLLQDELLGWRRRQIFEVESFIGIKTSVSLHFSSFLSLFLPRNGSPAEIHCSVPTFLEKLKINRKTIFCSWVSRQPQRLD